MCRFVDAEVVEDVDSKEKAGEIRLSCEMHSSGSRN